MCIDPTKPYNAVIDTSVGPLKMSLYTDLAPNAVNNLAVLARYHYWDGLPLDSIIPRATSQVATDLTTDGKPSPGYTLPGEYQKGGIVITPGMLAFAPVGNANQIGGTLILALGDQAADLPPTTTMRRAACSTGPTRCPPSTRPAPPAGPRPRSSPSPASR